MDKLAMFEREFNDIVLNDDLTKVRKNMLFATIMTKMESEFKIPFLKNESDVFENENITNKRVMTLYRSIANARQF